LQDTIISIDDSSFEMKYEQIENHDFMNLRVEILQYGKKLFVWLNFNFYIYRKVASFNMSRLEAHAGFFRLLMKGIFDPYVL
jgi:hypothetical protein